MNITDSGCEQQKLWNGPAGRAWVDSQQLLDLVFQPFETLLVDAAVSQGAQRVLDIGCGTGAVTLGIARRLGPTRAATGIDISEPMLTAARARARKENLDATFLLADAQTYAFAPNSFDMLVSRFGVMFFGDPVQAFANLRKAASPGALLQCIAFRGPQENAFMTTAERAAAPLLRDVPARDADGPGQFAFAGRDKVQAILTSSGWRQIDVQPLDVPCSFPAVALDLYLEKLGPVGLALAVVDESTRARVLDTVRAAFSPFLSGSGDQVRFTAACWILCARAPHTTCG